MKNKIFKTERLLELRSMGTISKENAELLDRRMELGVELNNPHKWMKNVKKRCVGLNCFKRLPQTFSHYKLHGNYCGNRHNKRI